jgi:hypothetical protein
MADENGSDLVQVAAEIVPSYEIDKQIATAKSYPRDIVRFRKNVGDLIASDNEIAKICYYLLPKAQTQLPGPSVRLAEICAHFYTNLRVNSQVLPIGEDDRFVRGQAMAWDLESNVAIAFQSLRRCTDANGRRYRDDVVQSTANAAVSIAIRNAIFKTIPTPFWKPFYDQAIKMIRGDVRTLPERRGLMLADLAKQGISPEQVCAAVGAVNVESINQDHIVIINGIMQAIDGGETSLEAAFRIESDKPSGPKRKSDSPAAGTVVTGAAMDERVRVSQVQTLSPEPINGQVQEVAFDPSKVTPESSAEDRLAWIEWLVKKSSDAEFQVDQQRLTTMTSGLKGPQFIALLVGQNKRKAGIK